MTGFRYEARQIGTAFGAPWDVYDTHDKRFLNQPAPFSGAMKAVFRMNTKPPEQQPAPPCCDRCSNVPAAFEHFLTGLAPVLRSIAYADDAERLAALIAETRMMLGEK